jgi:nitrate/nitrite-specific signal transduction histidine kinase
MRGSLRRKILTWTFLPAAAIFLIVSAASFYLSQAVVEELVIDRDRELARLTAAELSASLEEYPTLLSGVARDLSGVNLNGPTVERALTNNANRLTYFDGGAVLLNNLGRVVAAFPERPDVLGADWSARSHFRDIIQSPNRPAISDIVADGPDGSDVLAVAVPVFGPTNELRGVLIGMFHLGVGSFNPLYGTLIRLRLDQKGDAHVVDGRGRIIFASDTGASGQSFHDQPVAEVALSGESGALRTPTAAGTDVLASYSPIPGTSWSLIIEEEWATLMGPLRNFSALLSALLALGVIIPALVVAAGMRRVTRPIDALVEGTRQVARGDFGRTVEAHTGDELEMLAEQFNNMSAQLQASYTQLEQRVTDRTRELQTVLQIARNLASTLELQPLLSRLLDQLKEVVDYRFARLFIIEDGQTILFEERGFTLEMPNMYYLSGTPETEAMLTSGEPLIVEDTHQDSPLMAHLRRISVERGTESLLDEMGSFISLPLLARERMVGILTLIHGAPGYYTPARVEVVRAFAAQAAVAIENARLFTIEQERVNQLRVINQVSQTIAGILDVDGLLRQTAALIHKRFGYDHVGIGLVEGEFVVYRAGAGQLTSPEGDVLFSPNTLRVGKEGLTGRVAATGLPIVVPDVKLDPRYVAMDGLRTRSELVLPIKSKEVVIGVLDIQSERPNEFDQSDVDLLQALANQLAVAIENARLYEGAGQLAALEERQKLARELHDSVSQALYGIALGAQTARRVLERTEVEETLKQKLTEPLDYVLNQADAGMAEMRALIFELRPESLQSEGLVAALRKQTAALQARHQIPVTVEFGPEPDLPLPQKEMLYRVAQEAMHNIVKHARAASAEVRLLSDNGKVILEVCDSGQGFDMSQEFPGHLGLKSMRERVERAGGMLTIASAPAEGTRIVVKVMGS